MGSIITTIDRNSLELLVKNSNSLLEVLKAIGLSGRGHSYECIKKRLKEDNIRFDHFRRAQSIKKYTPENIFAENSTYTKVKNMILKLNLIEYRCILCNQPPVHNGIELCLQLDHKNGIHTDNRLENLRFLCPNCHTQTETYSGKNRKKLELCFQRKIHNCNVCNKEIQNLNKFNMCQECFIVNIKNKTFNDLPEKEQGDIKNRFVTRKFNVDREVLEKLTKEMSLIKIGKIFNVCDNSIRKRCKLLGIQIEKFKKGYWIKNKKNLKGRKFHIEKDELISYIKNEYTWSAIGRIFKVTGGTIKSRAEELGVEETPMYPDRRKLKDISKHELLELLNNKSWKEIANDYSVSINSLRYKAYEVGILNNI